MKKMTGVLAAAIFALSVPTWAVAAMDHKMDHGAMKGNVAHAEVVEGVKATFKITTMKEAMKEMKMEGKLIFQ